VLRARGRRVTDFLTLEEGTRGPPHELLAAVRPRERAPERRPFVYVNMVTSADGRAAVGGSSRALGSPADTLLLTELRAMADAVLIGTGTLRAEGYARLVAHPDRVARRGAAGLTDTPLAVLLSRTFDVPWEAGLFAAADQPVLVYTAAGGAPPAGVAAPVEVMRLADASPAAALADLRARGVRTLLCEGGPTLNGALLAAGLVDELFLTLAPLVVAGDAVPRVVAGPELPAPARLALVWALRHGDELFLRYAVGDGR
jgi:riboflavin-specific deaminase-like protein